MNLVPANQPLTMSSLEISKVVESNHADVRRSIERLANRSVISLPPLAEVSNDGPGPKTISIYQLNKRDSLIVVAQLCPEFTAKIVDRWQELEEQFANQSPSIPQTLPEALRLAADLAEQKAQAEARLAIAAPKADAFDLISASDEALTYTQAAKVLGLKRKDLVAKLHTEGWHYRLNKSWVAYDRYIKNGFLQYKEAKYTDDDTGSEVVKPYCHITQKGVTRLASMLGMSGSSVFSNLI